jgi:hypothetical protein
MDDAGDLAAIMKEMSRGGECGAAFKKWIKAEVVCARTGDDQALKKLIDETRDAAFYGAALGHGAAEPAPPPATKPFVVNESNQSGTPAGPAPDGRVGSSMIGRAETAPDEMSDIPPNFDRRLGNTALTSKTH